MEYITLDSIKEDLVTEEPYLNEIVEKLADKEFLDRIERGKYTRPNFKNPNVLGTFIVPGKAAVAYWSSLSALGLTVRIPNTIFVKTTTQKRCLATFP